MLPSNTSLHTRLFRRKNLQGSWFINKKVLLCSVFTVVCHPPAHAVAELAAGAKIADLELPAAAEQQVAGLDVPVADAGRVVQEGQAQQHLTGQFCKVRLRHHPDLLANKGGGGRARERDTHAASRAGQHRAVTEHSTAQRGSDSSQCLLDSSKSKKGAL